MGAFGSQAKADEAQAEMIAKLKSRTAEDLAWHTVKLNGAPPTGAEWTVEISSPLFVDGYYVPVRATEAWILAKQFGGFPLTRAVADQVHNHVLAKHGADFAVDFYSMDVVPLDPIYKGRIDPRTKQPIKTNPLYEFRLYWDSSLLQSTKYTSESSIHSKGVDKGPLVSGCHKLWVLSNFKSQCPSYRPRAVNYGFYFKEGKAGTKGKPINRGTYLDKTWNVFQGLGNWHDNNHWDYSQRESRTGARAARELVIPDRLDRSSFPACA
jgi:hypothetical protein